MITGNLQFLLAVGNLYYPHACFLWTWHVSYTYLKLLIEVGWHGMVRCMRSNMRKDMISISLNLGFSEKENEVGEVDIMALIKKGE